LSILQLESYQNIRLSAFMAGLQDVLGYSWNFVYIETAREKQPWTKLLILIGC